MRSILSTALGALLAALPACGESLPAQAARDVLARKTGTVATIKGKRGDGPFREVPLPPAVMVDVVTEVLLTKTPAVFPVGEIGEVVAKERLGADRDLDTYAPDWHSAVVVYVHPVEGDPRRSRFEVHATNRGPFLRGTIDWEREIPPLLEAAAEKRRREPVRPL